MYNIVYNYILQELIGLRVRGFLNVIKNYFFLLYQNPFCTSF